MTKECPHCLGLGFNAGGLSCTCQHDKLEPLAICLGIVLCLAAVTASFVIPRAQPEGRHYDCRMAEFHPDFPPEVRKACRNMIKGAQR